MFAPTLDAVTSVTTDEFPSAVSWCANERVLELISSVNVLLGKIFVLLGDSVNGDSSGLWVNDSPVLDLERHLAQIQLSQLTDPSWLH